MVLSLGGQCAVRAGREHATPTWANGDARGVRDACEDGRMSDCVIFDVDGTLIDSTYLHALAWERAFSAAGYDVPTWRAHRVIGMGGDKVVAELLGAVAEERDGDRLREAWEAEYDKVRDEVRPLPGAAELLRRVHEQGFTVALASSGKDSFVEQAIELLGVAEVVDAVTTTDDADNSKPDPDLLRATLDKAGCDRAVMVGDSPYDVLAAKRIGLNCVCFRTGGFGADELERAGAAVIVDEPKDALELGWAALINPAG